MSLHALFLVTVLLLAALAPVWLSFLERPSRATPESAVSTLRLEDIPFNGQRAYDYLKQLTAIGPRPSGSPGMQAQQKLLAEHFAKLGGRVEWQPFQIRHPRDGSAVPMANLIVRWHPERKERILLCAHYDTLPFPLMDPENPRGVFVGANDGASGVAVLMELAHDMAQLPVRYGVDFVLLDGEEFIFQRDGHFFWGSEFFARQYAKEKKEPEASQYRWGVLLDMVGDADLQLPQERTSLGWRDVKPLVIELWATAAQLGVKEFSARRGYTMQDDHVPLHNLGGVPICDIIDFDYPAWHTQADTADKCSALSLAKVGWVVRQWLSQAK